MRRSALVFLTLGLVALMTGCPPQVHKEAALIGRYFHIGATQADTATQSSSEHMHSLNTVIDLDGELLLEDFDIFWQRDRGTRLTRWHTR
jgi:hypothetical protein